MKLLKIILDRYKDEYELNLRESLTKTFEINQSMGVVKRYLQKLDFEYDHDFSMYKDGNAFHLVMRVVKKEVLDYEDLTKLANNLGWFPSYLEVQDYNQEKNLYSGKWNDSVLKPGDVANIRFEAKYDEQSGFKIPKYVYHVTSDDHVEKIKKQGLAPKSKSKLSSHPERVYITASKQDAVDIAKVFSQKSPEWKKTPQKNWAILTIDTEKIPGDYFKLYKDPNYQKGYYTVNNIPPYAIEKIDYYENRD